VLQGVARVDNNAQQYELVRYSVLQCVAVCCSVLQCVAVWLECSSELLSFSRCEYTAVGCSVLQ